MRLGLLLGGGGAVGIAWEHGVLAGLSAAGVIDPATASVVVGTSAGSVVGAEMGLGIGSEDGLVSRQAPLGFPKEIPDLEEGPFAEIIGLLLSGEGRTPEGAARVGALASSAETSLTEEAFVGMFRETLGTDDWPDSLDLRPTTTHCRTGRRQVWSADDGVELSRAVASSCAIPVVTVDGERYVDGPRGEHYHSWIVAEVDLDAVVFIGPAIAVVPSMGDLIRADMEQIAATGVATYTIFGSERLESAGIQMMDSSERGRGYEFGLADGADHAERLAAVLG